MIEMPLELYTDGSCSRNPGMGGLGYMLRYWNTEADGEMPKEYRMEGNQGFRRTTNNRMEIMAIIYGIRTVLSKVADGTLQGLSQINAFSDSEYATNSISKRWIYRWQENNWMTAGFQGKPPAAVKNKDLWEEIIKLLKELQNKNIVFTISWVRGHEDNEFNNRCDELAVGATNGNDHIIDEEYEKQIPYLNKS